MSTPSAITWSARGNPVPRGDEVHPFKVAVSDGELTDLRERLARTRWPDEPDGIGWTRGVPLAYLRELAEHWRTRYDWRRHEARLNTLPQFLTVIDGQPIHFIHLPSPEPAALPLVLTHGWPGSVLEFVDLAGPLTRPPDPRDAYHVVIPSIPGFGFSVPAPQTGWTDQRIAGVWARLMGRLGYRRYGAHGGDFGAKIARALGVARPDELVGLQVTDVFGAAPSRQEANLADDSERRSVEAAERYQQELSGYGYLQSTKPQTLAYALTDSPVGQLAWIVEKFRDWTDNTGLPETAVDRDRILTNVTLYWLTGSAGSSAHRYADGAQSWFSKPETCTVPTGVAVFPRNISQPVRRIAERTNNIVRWSQMARGGHFPGLEQPELLVEEIRQFFRALRR